MTENKRFTTETYSCYDSSSFKDNFTNETFSVGEIDNVLNSLSDENDQLKKEISQLRHWNKCLAEKRHNELKQ